MLRCFNFCLGRATHVSFIHLSECHMLHLMKGLFGVGHDTSFAPYQFKRIFINFLSCTRPYPMRVLWQLGPVIGRELLECFGLERLQRLKHSRRTWLHILICCKGFFCSPTQVQWAQDLPCVLAFMHPLSKLLIAVSC